MKPLYFLILLASLFFATAKSQTFYDVNTVQEIEISFPQSNWDSIMDVNKNTTEDYLMASWVKINGIQYDSVGVRFKGNSSYNANNKKNPLHISLDEFKKQKHEGIEAIKLSNGYGDPSFIREVLAYRILEKYMHCPQANFAKVTINGSYYGVFTNDESIDKKFIADHFYSNDQCFVKCSSSLSPSAASKNSLKYINANSASYSSTYDLKSDTGWNAFIHLCDVVTNKPSDLPATMDMDRAIWMLAFNNLFVNLDSYIGVYAQNHYVYQDHTQHFNPIVWDLNMCFGAFPFAGQGTIGVGQKTLTELKEYNPLAHATDIAWPLINAVLADTTMKRKYLAHFKTMLSENMTNGNYQTEANQYQSIVNNALFADSNKLFSYQQFQGGLNTDVVFGSFTVPGISNLMEARKTFLQTIPELMAAEPTVNIPVFSQLAPAINTPINVTVAIANANASGAYLGYRFDVKEKFMPLPLLDDGLHNDGNANDGVYGNSFTMSGASMQYYVYAENTSIGKFLPARAEHEFLTFNAAAVVPQVGDLVINEFLAQNDHWNQDEYNDHEDWIELFNKTNAVLDLSNVYLSNNANAIAKWKLPTGTTIMPNAYLTIFADDDSLEKIYHTNFNISKDSGSIVLSNGNVILDSVNYFTQLSDTAYGRLPNGSGAFTYLIPTYGYENNSFPLYSSSIFSPKTHFVLYPNPANHSVTVSFHGRKKVNIFNIFGQPVFTATANNNILINTSNWTAGMYLVRCGNATQKLMIVK
jgi:hypothetical protein